MRIGLITDMHLGYSRGNREDAFGVNQREQDIIGSAWAGVSNLHKAGVEAIVDLGDMAHTPHPKKRALMALINMINQSDTPWYSANGNHTLQRTKSDIHLYDVLESLCPNFHGYTAPAFIRDLGFYLIPYGTEAEALGNLPLDTRFIGGHFACDDVPFPGEHVSVTDLPSGIPTFLGHYHTRKVGTLWDSPVYIGATDRLAWGEAKNPTGVAILDKDSMAIEFIDHPAREWLDLQTTAEGVMDAIRPDLTGKIVRLTVQATGPEYHSLDIKAIREIARPALEFSIRREGTAEAFSVADHADTQTYSLMEAWEQHAKNRKLRRPVLETGSRALSSAGVIE